MCIYALPYFFWETKIYKISFFEISMKLNYVSYSLFIAVGILMVFGTFGKLTGQWNFSSDWFWLLAGVGLVVEGAISLFKQKKFDKKYRIIEREI